MVQTKKKQLRLLLKLDLFICPLVAYFLANSIDFQAGQYGLQNINKESFQTT